MRIFILVTTLGLGLSPPTAQAATRALDGGLHALVAGDYHKADELLAQAVRERPNDPIARFNYASALRELGRGDEAIAQFRAAFDLARDEPTRADALYGIALTRDNQGNPALAAQAWNEYLGFARRFSSEQAAVAIARERLANDQRLAGQPIVIPGTQKAGR